MGEDRSRREGLGHGTYVACCSQICSFCVSKTVSCGSKLLVLTQNHHCQGMENGVVVGSVEYGKRSLACRADPALIGRRDTMSYMIQ